MPTPKEYVEERNDAYYVSARVCLSIPSSNAAVVDAVTPGSYTEIPIPFA
jgi:hypothetical protein